MSASTENKQELDKATVKVMTKEEIKDYRRLLEKEFMDKDNEIDAQLSYITIGSLAFFLTINERFLRIQSADYKIILILSLLFLLIAFVLILARKSKTICYDLQLISFLDKMSDNSEEADQQLLSLWDKTNERLKKIRFFVYLMLSVGVGLQVLFIALNYNSLT